MFNFCSLFSGSSGNCLLIQTDNTKILVDCGVSFKKINESLKNFNLNFENIDAILITHEHSDHTLALGTITKKFNVPIYINIASMKFIITPPAITRSLCHAGFVLNSHGCGSLFICSVSRDSSIMPAILQ